MGTALRWLMATVIAFVLSVALPDPVMAWGDEGHEVAALIAQAHLDPAVQKKVRALLDADTDTLTTHDIAAEATWADKLRNASDNGVRQNTGQWHFIDIEIDAPDISRACYGHATIPTSTPASNGPARDCIVDKIEVCDGTGKLGYRSRRADRGAQVPASFVGDIHQPLHASDNHDRGGNGKRVSAAGFKAGNLHHYWDTEFIRRLGPNAKQIAAALNGQLSEHEVRAWSAGRPAEWAMESFKIARGDAYGQLPSPNSRGGYRLPESYIAMATQDVAVQLSKAGIRLAFVLNQVLGAPG